MNEVKVFEDTGLVFRNNDMYANRKQLQEAYGVPRKTLADQINRLKEDGLVVGRKIAQLARDGKTYETEVYNLDEIISLGFRLRSEVAIRLQKFARDLVKKALIDANERIYMQQAELDYFWDKQDRDDLH